MCDYLLISRFHCYGWERPPPSATISAAPPTRVANVGRGYYQLVTSVVVAAVHDMSRFGGPVGVGVEMSTKAITPRVVENLRAAVYASHQELSAQVQADSALDSKLLGLLLAALYGLTTLT